MGEENEEDLATLTEGCFCSGLFGFGTEPVELLLDRSGSEQIRLFLSLLRLALLLNPQRDLKPGLASDPGQEPGPSSSSSFETGSLFAFSGMGSGGSKALLGAAAERLPALWKIGRIIPSAKSSSAEDWQDSDSRLPSKLNSKSEPGSRIIGCADSFSSRSPENEVLRGHISEHIRD